MLGAIRSILSGSGIGGGGQDPSRPSRLPPELVAAIGAASITFRSDDAEGNPRVSVVLPTVGSFAFDGAKEAAERIARAWPEIGPSQARHAATLLAGQVGAANRMHVLGRAPRRRSWVMDFGPPGPEDYR